MHWLNALFGFELHRTTLAREIVAGLTTFTTLSYIVVVNPAILANAGIPEGPSFVATVLVSAIGCFLMAFYANRPFAIAPYMGENAFIAFTVCKVLGFQWQTALAAIFIAGVLFILMTVPAPSQVDRRRLYRLLCATASPWGIGFFLNLHRPESNWISDSGRTRRSGAGRSSAVPIPPWSRCSGFVLIAVLVIRKVPGCNSAIGIVATAVLAFVVGIAPPPHKLLSEPPSLRPILWQLGFRGLLAWRAFPVVLTIFIMAFVDTMGTLIGLSARAGFLDESGQLPHT